MSPPSQVERFQGFGAEWDAFVATAPHATFFHRFGWRDVLEQGFGFRAHYLAARRAGRLVGILPLCVVPTGLRGRCLLSLPFAIEAGVCAAETAATVARRAGKAASISSWAACMRQRITRQCRAAWASAAMGSSTRPETRSSSRARMVK